MRQPQYTSFGNISPLQVSNPKCGFGSAERCGPPRRRSDKLRDAVNGRQKSRKSAKSVFIKLAIIVALSIVCYAHASGPGTVIEFALAYPDEKKASSSHHGSTHEITYNPNGGSVL